jgi:uncharacterized protein (DUF58 family)
VGAARPRRGRRARGARVRPDPRCGGARLTRAATPRLGAYAGLAALGLIAALALGRIELVALAAPFAALLGVGLAHESDPNVRVRVELDRDRALEGETVSASLFISADAPIARLDVLLVLPQGLESESRLVALCHAAETREHVVEIRCRRWGGYVLGEAIVRAHGRSGLAVWERTVELGVPLKVYPRPELLDELLAPLETQAFAGNQVARVKGSGIEFADLRPFVHGDPVRRVNWRATARRASLVVNESHPERNTDVIVFVDTFTEAARSISEGTLELAVRAASSLAAQYLERRDRVGLVSFGGILNWLVPGSGAVQRLRIVDALLNTEIVLNYAWKGVDLIPSRTLPPKALVVALTPLLDERAVTTLLDLRARGFDLAVVEVSPAPFAPAGAGEADRLAHRLWLLRREEMRGRYRRAGVPIVEWREGTPLAAEIEEVRAWRRYARVARA